MYIIFQLYNAFGDVFYYEIYNHSDFYMCTVNVVHKGNYIK